LLIRIQKIEDSQLNGEFIKSEEFGDLFETLLKEVTKRKMHSNMSILADFTAEMMIDYDLLSDPFAENFLKTIASLNP
jgi:hypothetical protein